MQHQTERWVQRANSFSKALGQLQAAVELAKERELSNLEAQGLIQGFEYTHELAWNTLRDYLRAQGVLEGLYGSRDTTRAAFKVDLIQTGEVWMDMIRSRNMTSHTYNEDTAKQIVNAILDTYCAEFQALQIKLTQLQQEQS
ncbi:MAG: nucleotidyltransferase substrate binding protein [Pseudomonadota bacterium]|nr:nucleotidyltransferase substrate binding protein [Pseudomonadota bacterium]